MKSSPRQVDSPNRFWVSQRETQEDYLEVARRHLKIVISGKGSPLLDYLNLGTNAFGADAIEVVWKMFFEAIPEHSTELRQGLGRHYQRWLKEYRISCWFPEE